MNERLTDDAVADELEVVKSELARIRRHDGKLRKLEASLYALLQCGSHKRIIEEVKRLVIGEVNADGSPVVDTKLFGWWVRHNG